ncbi:MerR family transcriptional regulator [Nocardiopsis gilva YIM 90087]|uniref:MerR family transcriptional regulator n=1 Tax=Nocardiopsis gilva YIM 90087 TaxID=1235441 RepID=A0A223S9W1_9ACTN|nr:MerR family transcriptional regulator [Nocardiopsis gilva]ASU84908.1 MerR family transcriptional regulator [Nocardiopsis gilva YIM 90087]
MTDTAQELTIGQAAERTALSVHTLRLYEREGLLLDPVRRRANGHRAYTEQDLEWLALITRFRASGMPLSTIRRYADLVRQGPGNERQRLELLQEHQTHVTAQMRELRECLELIGFKVETYRTQLASDSPRDPFLTRTP